MKILSEHKSLTIAASVFIIITTVFINIYFYFYADNDPGVQPVSEQEILESMPGMSTDRLPVSTFSQNSIDYTPLLVSAALITLLLLVIILVARSAERSKRKKSDLFKSQLQLVAKGLELYKEQKGVYPISATFKAEHYSGVHFGSEWSSYGFPPMNDFLQLLPDWPIKDDNVWSKVLYYPRDNGQRFDLYSKIDSLEKQDAHDYNKEDELPKALGEFNYKLSSSTIPVDKQSNIIEASTAPYQFGGNIETNSALTQPATTPSETALGTAEAIPSISSNPAITATVASVDHKPSTLPPLTEAEMAAVFKGTDAEVESEQAITTVSPKVDTAQ